MLIKKRRSLAVRPQTAVAPNQPLLFSQLPPTEGRPGRGRGECREARQALATSVPHGPCGVPAGSKDGHGSGRAGSRGPAGPGRRRAERRTGAANSSEHGPGPEGALRVRDLTEQRAEAEGRGALDAAAEAFRRRPAADSGAPGLAGPALPGGQHRWVCARGV